MLITSGWDAVWACAVSGLVGAGVVAMARDQLNRRGVWFAFVGAVVGALVAICWSEVVTSGPPWQEVPLATTPPWMRSESQQVHVVAMLLGAAAVMVLPKQAGAPGAQPRHRAVRAHVTLTITLVTALLGSIALGDGIAPANMSVTTAKLAVTASPQVQRLDVDVTVGQLHVPDPDPAFVEGPVSVALYVQGQPGGSAQVMLLVNDYLESSPWTSENTVQAFDRGDHAWSWGACEQAPEAAGAPAYSDYGRALVVEILILADGTGEAHVVFTENHRWWNASADRSEVWLPHVSFDPPSCMPVPGIRISAWSTPQQWSITETALGPNLAVTDELLEPLIADGINNLFVGPKPTAPRSDEASEEARETRWTVSSDAGSTVRFVHPMYKVVTENTRSRASTMTFVAALFWGLALTGVFELVRSAAPTAGAPEPVRGRGEVRAARRRRSIRGVPFRRVAGRGGRGRSTSS